VGGTAPILLLEPGEVEADGCGVGGGDEEGCGLAADEDEATTGSEPNKALGPRGGAFPDIHSPYNDA
jgi:hypothetical protein